MNTFINNQRLAQLAGVNFDSETIKPGPIVYSRTHLVCAQFQELAQMGSCVLITSFSDACCTDDMAARLPQNVRKWFSNNVTTHNERVVTVPLGIRTSSEGEAYLRAAIARGRRQQRKMVYMNFWRRIRNGNNPRRGLYEMFLAKPWITYEGGFQHVPMPQFYEQIASHPFVLSPPGAGPDCHRHWESMMLGSIPIVLRSDATRILDDMPCLQVNNWGEVTEQRLRAELPKLTPRFASPAMDKCWFEPWRKMILEA
jgi:hypothetical protein